MIILASFIQGAFAFGFALIAIPLLLLLIEPVEAVALTLVMAAAVSMAICSQEFRLIKVRPVLFMLAAALPGAWLGARLLVVLPAPVIKMVAGAAAVSAAVPMLIGLRVRMPSEQIALLSAGMLSGVLTASTGIGGPPVVLLLTNQGWKRDVFRASLGLYFAVISGGTVAALAIQGSLPSDFWNVSIGLAPAAIIGFIGGHVAAKRMSTEGHFQRIVILVVIVTGLVALISGVLEVI